VSGRARRPAAAALGCSPHSGWAVVVGLGELDEHLQVIVRERIELVDAGDPGAKQPYHAVEGMPVAAAAARLARYAASAERNASAALARIVERLAARGLRTRALAIQESAGRRGPGLAQVLASHALIHTADGNHFRDALAAAASAHGLEALRVPGRELNGRIAAATGRSLATLQQALAGAGRVLGPPWSVDQKSATLLAWLALAETSKSARGRMLQPGGPGDFSRV